MLLSRNIRLAVSSLRSSKWRSYLTMLGIIIGVASVVVTVSIGEGVKKQVVKQINELGPELITVRPGTTVQRDENGNIVGVNLLAGINPGSFSEKEWTAITETSGVQSTSPLNVVSGVPRYQDKTMPNSIVVGTTDNFAALIGQELDYGAFFSDNDKNENTVVIGKRVADELFGELAPIGKSIQVRGHTLIVKGIFKQFPSTPLVASNDYNSTIFMPYEVSKKVSSGQVQIYQILAKAKDEKTANSAAANIRSNLTKLHGGEEDFTVLKQDENLAVVSNMLNLLTAFIAGVAAISLLVGGIGVMNIMLVLVSERTREIGVRKAVGATNKQILTQFLVESSVLCVVGGLLGIILSVIANYLIRVFTDLQPVITIPIILISVGIALIVGIIFGTTPAVIAARKDPIESLRYE
ncbi:ABC transporter permease [Candidatus Saccharibacteria bacterium]|nr:ABC transporter permease [Candidatus Saccharibacteria bacterium]